MICTSRSLCSSPGVRSSQRRSCEHGMLHVDHASFVPGCQWDVVHTHSRPDHAIRRPAAKQEPGQATRPVQHPARHAAGRRFPPPHLASSTRRLPAHRVALLTKWLRAKEALAREQGQAPTTDKIVAYLGLTAEQQTAMEKAVRASRLRGDGGETRRTGSWAESKFGVHVAP